MLELCLKNMIFKFKEMKYWRKGLDYLKVSGDAVAPPYIKKFLKEKV